MAVVLYRYLVKMTFLRFDLYCQNLASLQKRLSMEIIHRQHFLPTWKTIKQVKALSVEDFCIWCGGWSGTSGGHAIMYIVERTSDTEVSFIVCNTGEGVGYRK